LMPDVTMDDDMLPFDNAVHMSPADSTHDSTDEQSSRGILGRHWTHSPSSSSRPPQSLGDTLEPQREVRSRPNNKRRAKPDELGPAEVLVEPPSVPLPSSSSFGCGIGDLLNHTNQRPRLTRLSSAGDTSRSPHSAATVPGSTRPWSSPPESRIVDPPYHALQYSTASGSGKSILQQLLAGRVGPQSYQLEDWDATPYNTPVEGFAARGNMDGTGAPYDDRSYADFNPPMPQQQYGGRVGRRRRSCLLERSAKQFRDSYSAKAPPAVPFPPGQVLSMMQRRRKVNPSHLAAE
jgi:hypothetical protein